VNRVAVVVPAHDEQDLLPACLASLAVAAAGVPVPVEVVVVADDCTDRTALIAAAAGAEVVATAARNVGRARAAGLNHALRSGPGGLWLATTDADSEVPPDWLRWQLGHCRAGADLVAGTVLVDDWTGWPTALPARYEAHYRTLISAAGHAHVHGANLGCTAAAYLAAGGFPPVTHDEDRALIARARAIGARVVTDPSCPVRTSSRSGGHAPHGFSASLAALAAPLEANRAGQ
jgi:glycosyltransferase involved in cell wall biosynthesis